MSCCRDQTRESVIGLCSQDLCQSPDRRRPANLITADQWKNSLSASKVRIGAAMTRMVKCMDATQRAQVEWPVAVVVSAASVQMYQAQFRHLFELELCERSLQNIWRIYQSTRPLFRCHSTSLNLHL